MDTTPIAPVPAPKHYPLVCAPERLEGAEARAAAFPHLNYDWAIHHALTPIVMRNPAQGGAPRDEGADLEYLQHRNRTLHGRRHWVR